MNRKVLLALLGATLSFMGCAGGSATSVIDENSVAPLATVPTVTLPTGQKVNILCATPNTSLADRRKVAQGLRDVFGSENVGRAATRAPESQVLDVYFHIIKSSSGEGTVTQKQIDDQITVMNNHFGGRTGGANTGIQFRFMGKRELVNDTYFNIDPINNPSGAAAMKSALHVGDQGVLNVYTVKLQGGLLGIATFPWWYKDRPLEDGVIMLYGCLPGGNAAPYNVGGVLSHETGHWVGLYHPFQGGCDPDLVNGGDMILDTPPEESPAFGCPVGRDSCPSLPGIDPIANFMDYSDESCKSVFSPGQATNANNFVTLIRATNEEVRGSAIGVTLQGGATSTGGLPEVLNQDGTFFSAFSSMQGTVGQTCGASLTMQITGRSIANLRTLATKMVVRTTSSRTVSGFVYAKNTATGAFDLVQQVSLPANTDTTINTAFRNPTQYMDATGKVNVIIRGVLPYTNTQVPAAYTLRLNFGQIISLYKKG